MATQIKKILVTGGSGFIGKHLMKVLGDRGANYDINTTEQGFMDILDYDMFKSVVRAIEPSAIIHLAAVSSLDKTKKDPVRALHTNIIGSYNVLKAASIYKIPVLLASSAAVFEPGSSLYAASKECMEVISGLFPNAKIVRMQNVYGPGSKSVVNKFIKAIKNKKEIVVNGNTVRDYIYIDDVVEALISIADGADVDNNIGTSRGVTLKELIKIIETAVGRKAVVKYQDPIKEIQSSVALIPSDYYYTPLEIGIRKLL